MRCGVQIEPVRKDGAERVIKLAHAEELRAEHGSGIESVGFAIPVSVVAAFIAQGE